MWRVGICIVLGEICVKRFMKAREQPRFVSVVVRLGHVDVDVEDADVELLVVPLKETVLTLWSGEVDGEQLVDRQGAYSCRSAL